MITRPIQWTAVGLLFALTVLFAACAGGGDDDDNGDGNGNGGGGIAPAPVITTTNLPAGTEAQAYSEDVVATDGEGDLSWQITAGNLPPGINLGTSTTGTVTISGTSNTPGTYNFTIEVTDSASPPRSDTADLDIIISPATGNLVDGNAVKGPFNSGTVEAHEINANGTLGASLGTGTVQPDGSFVVNVGSHVGAVHLTVTGGTYDDEATGSATQMHPLSSVAPAAAGGPVVNITPLTTMAATIALRRIGLGTPRATAINRAVTQIGNYFGVSDILTTVPEDLAAGTVTGGTDEADYGAILAAISEQANGLGVAADALVLALAEDLEDEDFDGQDNSGAVAISGGGNLSATAAQGDLATALGDFLASGANQSGLVSGDFTALTDRLNDNVDNTRFVTSISVTPGNETIAQQFQVSYTAQGTFSDGTSGNVTGSVNWDSSDPGIATISGSGVATAGSTPGTTTISAERDNAIGTATLTVGNYSLSSITVTPSSPTLNQGNFQQFTATANYSNATTEDFTNDVNWTTSDGSVATINGSGLATTQSAGTATITATEPITSTMGAATVTVRISYANDIQPIFNANCIGCHPPERSLNLTSYSNLMAGGNFGAVVVPGNSGASHIIDRLEGNGVPQMPYQLPPLPAATIQLVKDWIDEGALDN